VKTILMRLAQQATNARQEVALMLTLDVPLVFAPPPLNALLAQTVVFIHATLGSTAMLASVLKIATLILIVKAGKHAMQQVLVFARETLVTLRSTLVLETLPALVTPKEQSSLCVTRDPNYAQLAATLSQEWSVASMARVLNISARLETKVKLATLPESVTSVNVAQMDYAQITRTKTVSTTKVSAKIFLAPLTMPQQHVPPNLVP